MIDQERVQELCDDMGCLALADIATLFLDESDDVVARVLKGGFAADEIGDRLHFLKGSALNLGMLRLARICQEGESRAARGDRQPLDGMEFDQIYRESRSAFLAALDRLAPGPQPLGPAG